jgi:asparaginyl-tRNA synthetase
MSPVFRAENAVSTRHLAEFVMVEAEVAFAYDLAHLLPIIRDLLQFVVRRVLETAGAEWDFCTGNDLDLKVTS